MNNRIKDLVEQYRSVHQGHPWMGRRFHSTWAHVNEEVAFSLPLQGTPCIAQLVDHLTFWRKQALDKIAEGKFEPGDENPDNWKSIEQLKNDGWDAVKSEYSEALNAYLKLLSLQDDTLLEETYADPDFKKEMSYAELIQGVLHHDIYHLGQIRLLLSSMNG